MLHQGKVPPDMQVLETFPEWAQDSICCHVPSVWSSIISCRHPYSPAIPALGGSHQENVKQTENRSKNLYLLNCGTSCIHRLSTMVESFVVPAPVTAQSVKSVAMC